MLIMASISVLENNWGIDDLRKIQEENPSMFANLNWAGADLDIINALIPIREGRFGRHPPPPSYRTSTSRLKEWRKLAGGDQEYVIEKERDATLRASNNVGRRSRMRGEIRGEILRTPENAVISNTIDVPLAPYWDRTCTSPTGSDEGLRVYSSTCAGINKATIESFQIANKSDVMKGFGHVAGNVIRWLANYVSNHDGSHPFGQGIMGYIVSAKSNEDTYTWEMRQTFLDGEVSMYTFYHHNCNGEAEDTKELCKECGKNQYLLYHMCKQEVKLRNQENPTILGRHDYMKNKSPTVIFPHIQGLTKRIHVLSSSVRNMKATIRALKNKTIQSSNVNHDLLFDTKALKVGYEKLMCKAEVHEQEISFFN